MIVLAMKRKSAKSLKFFAILKIHQLSKVDYVVRTSD